MLTFNETNLAKAIGAIRSYLGLKVDPRLQQEFEAGLHYNLLSLQICSVNMFEQAPAVDILATQINKPALVGNQTAFQKAFGFNEI